MAVSCVVLCVCMLVCVCTVLCACVLCMCLLWENFYRKRFQHCESECMHAGGLYMYIVIAEEADKIQYL